MQRSTTTRVVIYARISEDSVGDAMKVADQLQRCRTRAAQQGWEVVAELSDNDISALKGDHRPGYVEVLNLVRAGKVDHVVVWQTSRLLRNRRERAEAIELFSRQRVGIMAVKGVSFDLSTAYGRGQAGLLGEFDTMESEVKAERVAAAAAARAEGGRPSGSLGYGWTKLGAGREASWVVNEREAAVVREIVDRLLAGETLRGVTAALNERREPSPEVAAWLALDAAERDRRVAAGRKPPAAAWGSTSVRKVATREANIAVRVHHRGRSDEARFEGCWPAIVDADKHHRLAAALADPARRKNGGVMGQPGSVARPGARRHLLSWGVAECGVCGSVLGAHQRKTTKYGRSMVYYRCPSGCVGRKESFLDEFVSELVIERLSRGDVLDLFAGDDEDARVWSERLGALRARLDDAADSYAAGEITRDQLRRISARLAPEVEHAEAQERQALRHLDLDLLRPLAGENARKRWDAMTVAQRHAVLQALRLRVVVNKSTKHGAIYLPDGSPGPGFDPDSIDISWTTEER